MATPGSRNPSRLSRQSLEDLQTYLRNILQLNNQFTDLRNKMEQIDIAYYRYKLEEEALGVDAAANPAGSASCGAVIDDVTIPVVVSQVDSFVAYLAEVYLSGYPIFPVVSTPKNVAEAEALEAIIDTHATIGQYPRHMLMAFKDGIKYNVMPVETVWEPIEDYELSSTYLKPTEAMKLEKTTKYLNRIYRRDPYNTVWDFRCAPVDVATKGEFSGFVELVNRIELKKFVNLYSTSGDLYNVGALSDTRSNELEFYHEAPTISKLLTANKRTHATMDWAAWMGLALPRNKKSLLAGIYEKFICYARIIPSEFRIDVPQPNSPQIWKFCLINGKHLIYARRMYTIFDRLPLSISQPLEDGFELQTPSLGESQIGFQDAASTLMNIRFNSARRAVSDRALYDAQMINPSDINAPVPAPKIPVRLSGLTDKSIKDAYYQIPFDPHGTDAVIRDAGLVLDMADQMSGLNKPFRGQFQKGNKTLEEYRDTMGNADNRLRLPAIMLEFQLFVPLKEQLKFNIFQYGPTGAFQNYTSGEKIEVTAELLNRLRTQVLNFRVADGYTPKSKLASTDFLMNIMQLIGQSQILQQVYGPSLPKMVAHLAQLGGVRGLDQYSPEVQPNGNGNTTGQPAGLPAPAGSPAAGPTTGAPAA